MTDSLSDAESSILSPATTYRKQQYSEFKAANIAYLGGVCVVCGTTEDLEFDHIDPETKKFNITDKYTCSFEFLKTELDKCQLLCCVHHKEKHGIKEHGLSMYIHSKCRCDICRSANTVYSRQYRKNRSVAQ